MKLREFAQEVYEILCKEYPNAKCMLNSKSPLELLIATQLSAQCRDERVNKVTRIMFPKFRDVYDYANTEPRKIEKMIKSLGLYKVKAKNIVSSCKRIAEVYNGQVPDNMEDLLTLDGVGRKTANLILGEVYGQPAYVVDTHVKRVCKRIGITYGTAPDYIEKELRRVLKPETSNHFCHLIVNHGRKYCKAINPLCMTCPLNQKCLMHFEER
ncbi:MAG: endonuclease III [Clostridia bacterium]|nr:endonuclease III [Clostridia bacterium]